MIFPLIDILGIDQAKFEKRGDRNWMGIHTFFSKKLPEIESLMETLKDSSHAKDNLTAAVFKEVVVAVKRQLSEMSFFSDVSGVEPSNEGPDVDKLKFAPLTNLGCESEFAKLDNRVKVSGGSTSVETHSRKNIVSTNSLLVDTSFTKMTEIERKTQWKWARKSPEVQEAKKLHKDFLETVKTSKKLALQKKEDLKKKKSVRIIKLLESCKEYGGPVTENSLGLLDTMNTKQLLVEIGYLRATVCPDVKQKRKVMIGDRKYKMETFPDTQLRATIRNIIKPESEKVDNVENLLLNLFQSEVSLF